MSRPIIGIVTNLSIDHTYRFPDCPRVTINEDYARSVIAAGGVPILLSPSPETDLLDDQLALVSGLVFAGGQDIDPGLYGQEPDARTEELSPVRDSYELVALQKASEQGLPVLAICRGMQIANVWRGGSLHPEVKDIGAKFNHSGGNVRTEVIHTVDIAPDSLLATAMGTTSTPVNSFHHQSVDKVGDGFVVVAHAPDGIIEAIELRGEGTAPMIGIQWHAEMLTHDDLPNQRLFSWLIEAAGERAEHRP